MVAHLYIIPESFAYNANYTLEELERKVYSLADDLTYIRSNYKEDNVIYVNQTVYTVNFYKNFTVSDILNNYSELKKILGRDFYNSLVNIIHKSKDTSIESNEVIEVLLDFNNVYECHGIIVFHAIETIPDTVQLLYGIEGWYKFRRHFLSKYPQNADFFIEECDKYFPRLYIHERNKQAIKSILGNCSKKIIQHLSALNNEFDQCRTKPYNRQETLKKFNSISGLDKDASPEGDIDRKKALSFEFLNDTGTSELFYCELHLKLLKDDLGTISTDRRIYFHEGKANVQSGKILIGHIGNHL